MNMLNRTTRYLLAAIQAILGWEWLMSGGNKLLSGTFPQGLATTLTDNFKDNPNNWYVAFLQQNILPHSLFYGYLIEWTETRGNFCRSFTHSAHSSGSLRSAENGSRTSSSGPSRTQK